MAWPDDGAVPSTHHNVVAVFEAVGARAVTDALFALFELLQKAKVTWDCTQR
jgi:hypothetical protein